MGFRAFWIVDVVCLALVTGGCAKVGSLPMTVAISPQAAAVAPGQTIQFAVSVSNDTAGLTWSASTGEIDSEGKYTAPLNVQSTTATVTVASRTDPAKSAQATIHVVAPGQVSTSANPQVALYSIAPGAPGNVSVQFGPDMNYELTTWTQPAQPDGGPVSLFVAGMRANSTYHLRGLVEFSDGATFTDADQTFATGALPSAQLPAITTSTTPGMTPQSGVELLDLVTGGPILPAPPVIVTDLNGNVIWSYSSGLVGRIANPIKLLPNGHFLINYSIAVAPISGANSVLQEIDLSGAVIWQMTADDLNAALAAATCAGCNITILGTHHDFAPLPSGHLIVIASTQRSVSGVTVTGDAIIDLDENRKPVWIWNEFDHLDVNRQPMGFPDWTHTNAVIYSADDGNLIVSIRHQNWLIKVDYANGTGAGDILWKLGYQGDFALLGGTDPTDWFYAQHGPSFVSKNTTGKFTLALFDNGNDRAFPSGVTCGTAGEPPCLYSTVPIFQIDEAGKTATLIFNPATPTYSTFGGNAAVMKNGNVEYCETAGGPGTAADIYEVLAQASNPLVVWQMQVTGQFVYRGQRIPSFYPGVQ